MLDKESILRRLQALREYVDKVRPYQSWAIKALVDNYIVYMGVLHSLQLAAQCVMDISSHLQVALGLDVVDDYEEVIANLGKHGILPYDFAERIRKIPGFRNVIVHEYLTIDPVKVYDRLQYGLADFEEFIEHIYTFLEKGGYLEGEKGERGQGRGDD